MPFGVGSDITDEIVEKASQQTDLLADIAKYLKGLWEYYVLPVYFGPIIVNLAAGASTVIQTKPSKASMLTVSITAGQVDVWLDNRGGVTGGTPHFRFTPVGMPVNVPLPPQTYAITVFNSGAVTATGCVLPTSA